MKQPYQTIRLSIYPIKKVNSLIKLCVDASVQKAFAETIHYKITTDIKNEVKKVFDNAKDKEWYNQM